MDERTRARAMTKYNGVFNDNDLSSVCCLARDQGRRRGGDLDDRGGRAAHGRRDREGRERFRLQSE